MKNKKIIIGLCSVLLISGASLISCNNNDSSNDILSSTVSVDKLALERRITYISNNMINDEYQNNYTKESYDNLVNELNNAKKVLNKENVTQEELDNALNALNEAVNNLKPKEVSNVTVKQISSFIDSMNVIIL